MTIDEAILHCEEVVKSNTVGVYDSIALGGMHFTQEEIYKCNKCAEEHRQLAEWLKELKAYRETYPYGTAEYPVGQRTDCGWGEPKE